MALLFTLQRRQTATIAELAEAHRYVDTGRKTGNVVITVQPA